MKFRNLTISIDEDLAQWVRVWAARRNTSVSRLVSDLLRQIRREEEGYEAAMQQYLSRKPVRLKAGGRYPSREVLHERLRRR